ncbi:hypothetical protein T484DRAFT_1846720 [Baffinella frigidus]|nr:hypothetical protein T484DRAFT_1846720 [Cryptophyta sp. CCMP2293]
MLVRGAPCVVKGLVSAPQHNGKRCVLTQFFLDVGRWQVTLEDGKVLRVEPVNLRDMAEHAIADGILAIATRDGWVQLLNVITGEERCWVKPEGAKDGTTLLVAMSPDGRRFATGDATGHASVFDTVSGAMTHELAQHAHGGAQPQAVDALAWAPCSRRLAAGFLRGRLIP